MLSRISATWLAIVGLWTLGLASITVASAAAPLTAEILMRWSIRVEAVLTQILLVLVVCSGIALGLLARSRVAYGLALGIGLLAIAWWLHLLATSDPVAAHRLAVLIGASGLLVSVGLLLDATLFWRDASDGSGPSARMRRRPNDRALRPPR
jgi:hypothetical protein